METDMSMDQIFPIPRNIPTSKGWSDDKTEEKDGCEVKYHPNSSVDLYHIVKVLEKLGFFREFWRDYLRHMFTLSYFSTPE
jgi:hypothetical protein